MRLFRKRQDEVEVLISEWERDRQARPRPTIIGTKGTVDTPFLVQRERAARTEWISVK